MSGFISTEVRADSIIETMCEDAGFNFEMWMELANGLHKGLLLDVTMDQMQMQNEEHRVYILNHLRMLADFMEEQLNDDTGPEA